MDEHYIRSVLEGDINSFRHIVSKYTDMSFSISMSIVKSELIAQEAVQDAFVKAYQNLEQFKGKSKFSTWLYKIVVNESLRKIKLKKIEVTVLDDVKENISLTVPDSFTQLHEIEQKEIINDILTQMPVSESLLLRLYYLEENKIETISEITNLGVSNIKVTLHRARQHFYRILEQSLKHELRTIL
jgi:RNA polymerase sigma factor (sigma-70 family)